MRPMTGLVAATAAFFLTHFVASTPLRPRLAAALGEWPYRGAYSLVALATLAWMIFAYADAPREALWTGFGEIPRVVMPLAFILIACGYFRNPTMVGAERLLRSAEPARGIIRITRHPIMWGAILWAGAHLLARGERAASVFFGGFLVLAALGTVMIDRRKSSDPDYARFKAVTSNIPFVAVAQGRNRIAWHEIGWKRPAIGLAVFVLIFFLHPWISGGARP